MHKPRRADTNQPPRRAASRLWRTATAVIAFCSAGSSTAAVAWRRSWCWCTDNAARAPGSEGDGDREVGGVRVATP